MKGGEFLRFILDCWQSLTTLSISFHVFSRVFLSVRNFCWAHASEILPWIFEKNEMLVLGCGRARLVAAILTFIKTCNHNTHKLSVFCTLVGWSVGPMDTVDSQLPRPASALFLCAFSLAEAHFRRIRHQIRLPSEHFSSLALTRNTPRNTLQTQVTRGTSCGGHKPFPRPIS